MKTLSINEAAELVKLHPITLRRLAAAGEIPGAKLGKCWVFVDVDLIDYIRSKYNANRQDAGREEKTCSLNAKVVHIGTTNSQSREKLYTEALAPAIKRKPKP